jgi:hypothetical protein
MYFFKNELIEKIIEEFFKKAGFITRQSMDGPQSLRR